MSERARWQEIEAQMLRRRGRPANMAEAVDTALAAVQPGCPRAIAQAGRLIAAAVAAHAAGFVSEPAYHNQYHQAEATLAMGLLCAQAVRLRLLDPDMAALGVLALAGHDLEHDGRDRSPGVLEAHSAARTAALAAQAGLDAPARATLVRVILATDPMRGAAARANDDLLCALGQEADVFGSLTPTLGSRLSGALHREMLDAGSTIVAPVDSFLGRLKFLLANPPSSPPARDLGLDAMHAAQITAFSWLGGGSPEAGARALDALPPALARDRFQAELARLVK